MSESPNGEIYMRQQSTVRDRAVRDAAVRDTANMTVPSLNWILGLVTILLVMLCSIIVFGAVQMNRVHREIKRIAREVVPFAEIMGNIARVQLEQSVQIDQFFFLMSEHTDIMRTGAVIERTQREFNRGEQQLSAEVLTGQELLRNLELLLPDASDRTEVQRLSMQLGTVMELHERYVHQVRQLFDLGSGKPKSALVELQERVVVAQRDLTARTDEVLEETKRIVDDAFISAGRHQNIAQVTLAILAACGLLFGILLIVRIRSLHNRLLHSEQLALLAKTVVTLHHEINNPLAVIVGNAELVLSGRLTEGERRELLDAIKDQAMRVSAVLTRLSRIEHIVSTSYVKGTEMLDLGSNVALNAEGAKPVR